MEPISGKHDKKSIVSAYCKNKTTIYHDRALLVFRLDLSWHVVGSSPRHGEHTAFFSGFPLGGIPRLTHFAGYPFGASRKKQQPFSMARPTAKIKRPYTMIEPCWFSNWICHGMWLVHLHSTVNI